MLSCKDYYYNDVKIPLVGAAALRIPMHSLLSRLLKARLQRRDSTGRRTVIACRAGQIKRSSCGGANAVSFVVVSGF